MLNPDERETRWQLEAEVLRLQTAADDLAQEMVSQAQLLLRQIQELRELAAILGYRVPVDLDLAEQRTRAALADLVR